MDIYDKVVQANEWALEDIPIAIKNNIKAGKEKYYRVPWNYDSLIRSYIELGVLNWKKGVNPTNDFRNAHKAFKKRQRFISKKKLKPLNVEVPFYFAMYLIDETIFDLPSLTSEELKYEYHVYVRQEKILDIPHGFEISDAVETFLKKRKSKLITETFEEYFKLFETKDVDEIKEIVERCEMNYKRRRKDRVFDDSFTFDGGDITNEVFVDYWLGAILKKLDLGVDTQHKWLWG